MKKFIIFALCFVLIMGLMTACRGNSMDETSVPSTAATTNPTTTPTTATTKPTTAPTTSTEGGKINGNGDAANRGGRVNRVP